MTRQAVGEISMPILTFKILCHNEKTGLMATTAHDLFQLYGPQAVEQHRQRAFLCCGCQSAQE